MRVCGACLLLYVCVCVLASPKCSRRCFGFASTHVEKAVSSLQRLSLKLECRKVSSPRFAVVYDVARLNHYTETPLRSLAQRSHWIRKL
uniref:Putative secreted protein n=1 Tax=Rhipicephalus microplus TaxID=6941 RepID=A0A6G5A2I7_RHIMP